VCVAGWGILPGALAAVWVSELVSRPQLWAHIWITVWNMCAPVLCCDRDTLYLFVSGSSLGCHVLSGAGWCMSLGQSSPGSSSYQSFWVSGVLSQLPANVFWLVMLVCRSCVSGVRWDVVV
jgi:hypothetical protein